MPPPRISLFSAIRRAHNTLHASASLPIRPSSAAPTSTCCIHQIQRRTFTATRRNSSWLIPRRKLVFKDPKGRPRMPTGGSTRGTTVVWGDYGLRLRDHDRRISAAQLRNGEEVIRRRLRGTNFRLFTRWTASTAVYTKGNESRMGTGKGTFDYWAVRMPVSRILFEVKGDAHEQVIRDALRLAGNKLPGNWEFVRRGDPPVVGITKMKTGLAVSNVKDSRPKLPLDQTAERIPATGTS